MMKPLDISLVFHTVKYLKPRQFFYKAYHWLRNKGVFPFPKLARPYPGELKAVPETKLVFLSYNWWKPKSIESGQFKFLNEEVNFINCIDWQCPHKGRLWRYNLHYFQYLQDINKIPVQKNLQLIHDWINHNPPGTQDAWDPFPISLRVVNWLKFLNEHDISRHVFQIIYKSIFQQVQWLEKSLEFHLLGNHLFKNIKALIFAGLSFEGPDARRWLNRGITLLEEELREQILSDGGHFERSPMYHSMILEDCLDLMNIGLSNYRSLPRTLVEKLNDTCYRMLRFLFGMTHPDGNIALFNDAAFNIEPSPESLKSYYEKISGEKFDYKESDSLSFPESGYFVFSPTPGDKLIVDCGKIGPDYQPGHSHCDTLSFELSIKGDRVIVDSGCYTYEQGEMREYNRGNAGHNTLTIDGHNQSEVWGSHRCGRRAYPLYAELKKLYDGSLEFRGAHDGYTRLPGKPIHHRRIVFFDSRYRIEDIVEGRGIHHVESRLHFNPSINVKLNGRTATLRKGGRTLGTVLMTGKGTLHSENGWYCPEFGKKMPCVVLKATYKNATLPLRCGWIMEFA